MRHKDIVRGIIICLVVLFIAFCVMLATPAKAYEGERITTAKQDALHNAADILRSVGYAEDDEVSVGDRFGHYTVIAEAAPAITLSKRRRWLCRCDCGNERIVEEPNLRHGKSTNCGCVRYQNMIGNKYNFRENAHHKDRLHHIWVSMRSRCNSEKNPSYRNYGAKGVSVCAEWDDYEVFKRWAYENGYDDKAKYGICTIDRINPYGNYEPSNCRWISNAEQQKNKRKDWDRRMGNAI